MSLLSNSFRTVARAGSGIGLRGRPFIQSVVLVSLTVMTLLTVSAHAAPTFVIRKGVNLNTPFMAAESSEDKENRLKNADKLHAILQRIAAAKFDAIRLDIEPLILIKSTPGQRADLLKQIREFTDWATQAKLRTIVDIHVQWRDWQHLSPDAAAKTPLFSDYLSVVREVAQSLSNANPAQVAMELFNEPQFSCAPNDAHAWNELNRNIFHEARSHAPSLYILVAGACWDKIEGLLQVKAADFDDHTLFTFHFYEPDTFTAAGEPWSSGPEHYFPDLPFPPDGKGESAQIQSFRQSLQAQNKQVAGSVSSDGEKKLHDYFSQSDWTRLINSRFDLVSKWAASNAVSADRIIVGEFGAYRGDPAHEAHRKSARLKYLKTVFNTAEKHRFGALIWEYFGVMGITQSDENSPIDEEIASW
jgi:endoglucanase